ncbi:hypothetical protein CC86DRAFT_408979 [Ophiobolus disseminans]|uniref:Uncharacterized protein n=1 Tax=Ophiobolus disseminans TaxID=1469910 RepID=A0A6A6ZUF0_9PLEO|nr:hypothetical protein CC86DRAFT_408979 [Ophiobolus disseminans]
MQGVLIPNGNALRCRPYIRRKIKTQKQQWIDMSPDQRQTLVEHILSLRQGPAQGAQKVETSGRRYCPPVAVSLKDQIATKIVLKCKPDWQQLRADIRTRKYLDQQSITTYNSIDDYDRSTPPPENDSGRGERSETDWTSSDGDEGAELRTIEELKKALKQKEEEVTALQSECDQTNDELQNERQRYAELKGKHDKQVAQRQDDKEKVDDAWAYCRDADEKHKELQDTIQTLQNEFDGAKKHTHKHKMAAMEAELERTKALVNAKNEELGLVSQKATAQLHEVTKTCESNRQAWKLEKKGLEPKLSQMDADAGDVIKRNENEIMRITTIKRWLEQEVDLLVSATRGDCANATAIRDMVTGIQVMQKELHDVRRSNTILEEKIENTLESMQQERDLQNLEYTKEKVARRDELLHNLEDELKMKESRAQAESPQDRTLCSGVYSQLLIENLRNQINNGVSTEKDQKLREHLQKTTVEIQVVTEQASEMRKELTQHRTFIKDVQDKCDTEVMKINKEVKQWFTLYYDKAVPKVETMIRAEFHEPGYVAGWVLATIDALRVLRPLGWAPVFADKKVYLQPMYKPFTEEDAAARLQAQEQKSEKQQHVRQATKAVIRQPVKVKPASVHIPSCPTPVPTQPRHTAAKAMRTKARVPPTTPSPAPLCTLGAARPAPLYEPQFTKFMDMTRAKLMKGISEMRT